MFAVKDDDKGIPIRVAKISILISEYLKRTIHNVEMACRAS
jgi:hypothetical protein